MSKPIRKIKCKICKREVDVIILKEFVINDEKNSSYYNHFQKLLVKHHKTGIFMKPRCKGAGRRFTIHIDQTFGLENHC